MKTKIKNQKRMFLYLFVILIIASDCADQNEGRDAEQEKPDAGSGGDVDADADADTDSDADGDFDSGTDAGGECKQYVENDKCMQTLECWCEYHPSDCEDTLEESRKRAERFKGDGGIDMIYICFSLCTDGAGYIKETCEGTGPTRYFDSSGKVIGIYHESDVNQYCEDSGDPSWEIYIGNTDGCEVECQIGRDCSGNYPECD